MNAQGGATWYGSVWDTLRDGAAWNGPEHLALLAGVAAALAAYALLLKGLAIPGRERQRHSLWFIVGLAAFYLAESPPLHAAAERMLLSAHMAQHMLLILVFPVGVLRGIPPAGWAKLIARPWSMRIVRFATRPLAAFLVYHFAINVWHVPAFYDLALRVHWVHGLEHACFAAGALAMWWPLVEPHPAFPRMSPPAALLYLFGLIAGPLAVTGPLVFLDDPAYAHYVHAARPPGMSLITDQQAAGLIMKVPGTILFAVMFCRTFLRWASETRTQGGSKAS